MASREDRIAKPPVLMRCILAAADPANGTATTYDPVRHPGVYKAAAILLKKRDKAMSLIPYVISTVLKVGKTSKTVSSKKPPLSVIYTSWCNCGKRSFVWTQHYWFTNQGDICIFLIIEVYYSHLWLICSQTYYFSKVCRAWNKNKYNYNK